MSIGNRFIIGRCIDALLNLLWTGQYIAIYGEAKPCIYVRCLRQIRVSAILDSWEWVSYNCYFCLLELIKNWQVLFQETEDLLEKWKHPDPYRPPTAPGGTSAYNMGGNPIAANEYQL